jgi:hypothetical protein
MSRRFHISIVFLVLLCCSKSTIFAYSKMLPINSINYIAYFSKAEFDELYPGVKLGKGKQLDETVYYVAYQHENLTYYFGPEVDLTAAEIYKVELDKTVRIVQGKRSTLLTAKTWIVKPSIQSQNNSSPNMPKLEEERKRSQTPAYTVPIEPWWQKVFRIFGL